MSSPAKTALGVMLWMFIGIVGYFVDWSTASITGGMFFVGLAIAYGTDTIASAIERTDKKLS